MSEVMGKDYQIKVSGAALAIVGEAMTSITGNLVYQITNAVKQVLDRTAVIRVHKKGTNDEAESGTNTTNIKMTAHGLATNDLIINTSRSNAARLVTFVDVDNVTVASITGQTEGDTIEVYKTEAPSGYTLNRLNGKVTYGSALVRVLKLSGSYLPMSIAAYANSAGVARISDMYEVSAFGGTHKKRIPGLKAASGKLTQFNLADTTYADALAAGNPVVIENRTSAAAEPNRFWAYLDSDEVAAANDSAQSESVSWVSTDEILRLGN